MDSNEGKGKSGSKEDETSTRIQSCQPQFFVGGNFDYVKGKVEYVGGQRYIDQCMNVSNCYVHDLRVKVKSVFEELYGEKVEYFSMWFLINNKRHLIDNMADIWEMCYKCVDKYKRVNIYVLLENPPKPPMSPRRYRCKNLFFPEPKMLGLPPLKPKQEKVIQILNQKSPSPTPSPLRRSPRFAVDQDAILTDPQGNPVESNSTVNAPPKISDPISETNSPNPKKLPTSDEIPDPPSQTKSPNSNERPISPTNQTPSSPTVSKPTNSLQITPNSPQSPTYSPITTRALIKAQNPKAKFHKQPRNKQPRNKPPKRVINVRSSKNLISDNIPSAKEKGKEVLRSPENAKIESGKGKGKKGKAVKKGKGKKKKDSEEEDLDSDLENGGKLTDSDNDTDVEWFPEDEEFDNDARFEELRIANECGGTPNLISTRSAELKREGIEKIEVGDATELYYDSDDLRSVDSSEGSGDEDIRFDRFNPEVDFRKPIVFKQGLKFPDVHVLRKALQRHSIEGKYDYYLLHNNSYRISAYCRYRCDCPWDSVHGIIAGCTCGGKYKCNFRLYARKMKGSSDIQIKTLNLVHDEGCVRQDVNLKVTSKYLAERYLDVWRADPNLSLEAFVALVQNEVGACIGYYKAWYARARAKIILYGDASEEYARVYDYARALLKHNPGSTVKIMTEGDESGSSPCFQRMYICLEACKSGFKAGCRPLIGVDGCHLRGAYPGMILAAMAKDGNNCIYPVAWAVVEVESTDSWTWFLDLLAADLETADGDGLTVMSDRQKGLIEAVNVCLPKAEVRYCVRHIWSNFKKQFSGQAFKEYFWHAARTCNKHVFDTQMAIIKLLDVKAFEWLDAIPKEHWARHKFNTYSKSNLLLNNICETFNGVIRAARDKPIITCMEWIRKYVMKRNFQKLQSLDKVKTSYMPYIEGQFKWISAEAQHCYPTQCSLHEWEVEHNGDCLVVNLENWSCDCGKWSLTGIPCPHAYACIRLRREKPETYVHHYYSKSMYLEAYKVNVRAMPGIKHWEQHDDVVKPLPPKHRVQPGRPSKKKRKKDAAELEEGKYVKRPRRQNTCKKCGTQGHTKKNCQNLTLPPQPTDKGGRPFSDDVWCTTQRKKKERRAQQLDAAAVLEGRSSQPLGSQPPHLSQQSSNNSTFHIGESSNAQKKKKKNQVKPTKKNLNIDLNN
ncbi:Filamentous hemagglutinin [Bienertia sinuspersici]